MEGPFESLGETHFSRSNRTPVSGFRASKTKTSHSAIRAATGVAARLGSAGSDVTELVAAVVPVVPISSAKSERNNHSTRFGFFVHPKCRRLSRDRRVSVFRQADSDSESELTEASSYGEQHVS